VGAEEPAVTPEEFQESAVRQREAVSAFGEAPAQRGGEREEEDQ
jgi:hypothetical protein